MVIPHMVVGPKTSAYLQVPKIKVPSRQETKEELHDYANHFFSDSQLHGFREAYMASNKRTRAFWVVVCVLCGGMAMYEIGQISNTYRKGSMATQISIVSDDALPYPTLLLCPTAWIDKSKMKKLNITRKGLEYLGHRMEQLTKNAGYRRSFHGTVQQTKPAEPKNRKFDIYGMGQLNKALRVSCRVAILQFLKLIMLCFSMFNQSG